MLLRIRSDCAAFTVLPTEASKEKRCSLEQLKVSFGCISLDVFMKVDLCPTAGRTALSEPW